MLKNPIYVKTMTDIGKEWDLNDAVFIGVRLSLVWEEAL